MPQNRKKSRFVYDGHDVTSDCLEGFWARRRGILRDSNPWEEYALILKFYPNTFEISRI